MHEPESFFTSQSQKIHCSTDNLSRSNYQSGEIRFDFFSEFRINRNGILDLRQHSSSSNGQGARNSPICVLVTISELGDGSNISISAGKLECSCPVCSIVQTTSSTTSNGSILAMEVSYPSSRSQNLSVTTYDFSFNLVEQQGFVHSRSFNQTITHLYTRHNNRLPLYVSLIPYNQALAIDS